MKTLKQLSMTFLTTSVLALGSLGIASAEQVTFLNKGSKSTSPFSEAVKVGDTLYLAGKLGVDPSTGKLPAGGIKAEAHQALKNIKQALNKYDYQMSDVVKCMVILDNMKDFADLNQVYRSHFTAPYPARTTFAVSGLAIGAKVEIECTAVKKS